MSELGPLDTKWKIRDPVKGFITNEDGTISAVVHQWDRWASEMGRWLDSAFVRDNFIPGERELFDRPPAFVEYDPATCRDMPWKSAHRSSCAGLRAEHHDWVSSPPERRPAKEACCKFGGGIKTGVSGVAFCGRVDGVVDDGAVKKAASVKGASATLAAASPNTQSVRKRSFLHSR